SSIPPGWPAVPLAEAHALLTAPGSLFEMEEKLIRGVRIRVWKNAPPTLRDVLLNMHAFKQRTALVYEDERVTYDAFIRATLTLAHELIGRGVRKGDRVALIMRNLPEWPVAFFASAITGAIITPLNAWWTGPELEYALVDSGTKIALVDGERWQRIAEHLPNCPALERVYVSRVEERLDHPRITQLEEVIGDANSWQILSDHLALPEVELEPEDDATIFYTSGTTGKPKGALGTHRSIVTNILTSGFAAARAFVRRGEPVPPPDPEVQRVALLVVPMFHVTGCNASLIPHLNAGGKIVLMRKWDVERAMQLIEREKVMTTGGVPTIAWQLVEHPAREKYDLSSLIAVGYGGAPSAPELVKRIKEVFPQSMAGNGWGMTETSATFTSNNSEDYQNRPASCGPPAPVGELKIMSLDGTRELPIGEVGELWAKGPQVVKGYWGKPDATAQTFSDGWVRTGDLAQLDEEGFCYIIDRAKDMLIRGGENIYCVEVENALYEHPAVIDAALIGLPHRTLGEEPAAVVHLKPGTEASEEELRRFVAERLAAFKVPVKVFFMDQTLPRNPQGKILKHELKKLFT
ncbi:MAG TPA: class I adenylate-forming enzyme family protein, partial [Polyangiales bacterium]|nr:class I adenylate-forming enzyme family protein [Polyangiales bacterium]